MNYTSWRFLVIDVLIPAVIAQIFNANAESGIPTGIPTKEEKAEIGIIMYFYLHQEHLISQLVLLF